MISREQKLNKRFSHGLLAAKKIVNTFTGESEKKAGKQAVKELAKGREAVSGLAEESRGTLFDLFGDAQGSRRAGLQGALDVFGESVPLQAETTQAGNVAAQQQLLAGLPLIQRAIIGRPTDLSTLQPTEIPFDLNFTAGQLPETAPIQQATNTPETPNIDIAALLAGNR